MPALHIIGVVTARWSVIHFFFQTSAYQLPNEGYYGDFAFSRLVAVQNFKMRWAFYKDRGRGRVVCVCVGGVVHYICTVLSFSLSLCPSDWLSLSLHCYISLSLFGLSILYVLSEGRIDTVLSVKYWRPRPDLLPWSDKGLVIYACRWSSQSQLSYVQRCYPLVCDALLLFLWLGQSQ